MAQSGRLISTLVLQCIALSLANQNLVPIFISEIGKPFIGLRSKEPWGRDPIPRTFPFEIGRGGKSPGNKVGPHLRQPLEATNT